MANTKDEYKLWDERMKNAAEAYATRPAFTYNPADDPLYNQYKEQYIRQGRLAMQDTMGQARANNGGYGTSYAQTAGQQAYNSQIGQLNDKIPQLYQVALDRYQNAGTELMNQYNFAAQQKAMNAPAGSGRGSGSKMTLVQGAYLAAQAAANGASQEDIIAALRKSGLSRKDANSAYNLYTAGQGLSNAAGSVADQTAAAAGTVKNALSGVGSWMNNFVKRKTK